MELSTADVDTLAGVMVQHIGRVLQVGDQVDFNGTVAEVIEVEGARAKRIRMTPPESTPGEHEPTSEQKGSPP